VWTDRPAARGDARVRRTGAELADLVGADDPDLVRWARTHAGQPGKPVIAVVGETKTGKSSLVNAMIGVSGLSPVDPVVSTGRHIVFTEGAELTVQARLPGDGSTGLAPGGLIRRAATDDRLPEDITSAHLIDTPGVGGLDPEHDSRAMSAAASATALLFVTDASAPLSAGELAFLNGVAARIEVVLFVLTRIDAHPDWARVSALDRRLLAEHTPRLADCPLLPISVRLFDHAATLAADEARALRERSGVPALGRALDDLVAGRRAMLTEANALRGLATGLAAIRHRVVNRERSLIDGDAETQRLRRRRDELVELRRVGRRACQVGLRAEVARARLTIAHQISASIRELHTRFRALLDSTGHRQLTELPATLDAELRVLARSVTDSANTLVAQVIDTALAETFSESERLAIHAGCPRAECPSLVSTAPGRRPAGPEDRLLVLMSISGGVGVGKLAAVPLLGLGVAALTPLVWPVSIGLGLGAGYWMARTRRAGIDRQHLRQWLTETVTEARALLERVTVEQMIDVEARSARALQETVAERIVELDEELKIVDKSLRADRTRRQRCLAEDKARIAELVSGEHRCQELLRRIDELRS
jgi:hypothetical protein